MLRGVVVSFLFYNYSASYQSHIDNLCKSVNEIYNSFGYKTDVNAIKWQEQTGLSGRIQRDFGVKYNIDGKRPLCFSQNVCA